MAKSTDVFSLSLALSDASESGNMRENQALVSSESDWARGYHAENGRGRSGNEELPVQLPTKRIPES